MKTLARIWYILVLAGIGAIVGGGMAIWNRVREPEPTVLTWSQFVQKTPDKSWFRIDDAPFVDARTVHLLRKQKFTTAEEAYVPLVADPSDPMGPVKVFVHATEDAAVTAPAIAGVEPSVRRAPLEGRRISLSNETRDLLARQAPPVAPDLICLRAGPLPPLSWGAGCTLLGLALIWLGLKARKHRAGAQPELATETAAQP